MDLKIIQARAPRPGRKLAFAVIEMAVRDAGKAFKAHTFKRFLESESVLFLAYPNPVKEFWCGHLGVDESVFSEVMSRWFSTPENADAFFKRTKGQQQ